MVKIIGLGNALRGDDCVGLHVLEKLRTVKFDFPVDFVTAGSDAFLLLEHLLAPEPVIIIDCAEIGQEPGTFLKLYVSEKNLKKISQGISLHGFSFAETYQMAKKMGGATPCTIFGIQPKTIEFNTDISTEVKRNIPIIVDAIIEEVKKYGSGQDINHR